MLVWMLRYDITKGVKGKMIRNQQTLVSLSIVLRKLRIEKKIEEQKVGHSKET